MSAVETKRARRRRDLKRMKAKALRLYPHDARATLANHLAVCSCAACGNPRGVWKHADQTLQERRNAMRLEDED